MAIIIRCHSCGFVLAVIGAEDVKKGGLRSIDLVLREWGYRCPVCMSPLSRRPITWKISSRK